jgi:hypothetical protein
MPVTATKESISLSSSGYVDGLGRRTLEVDRESGAMIERLLVRPELTAFEHVLSARVARAAMLKDERFARPRQVAWDDEGHLTVASNYVSGRRLSDVIEIAGMGGVIGGIDAAIGLLLELLPALSHLHSEMQFAHGLLGTGRLTVTPAGALVVLDWVYGATIEHLQLTRQRLWDELGLAAHPSPGPPRLDLASDLTQAAMIAAAIVVGRALGDQDYPSGIPALRAEIVDVAQIRGNQEFARGIERFFERALPLRPRRVFSSADEALFELRLLVRNSIGVETCRAAFREFLQEAESVDPERSLLHEKHDGPSLQGPSHEHRIDVPGQNVRPTETLKPQPAPSRTSAKADQRELAPIPVERFELERIATERIEQERRAREEAERAEREKSEAERLERERIERDRAIREMEELQQLGREKAELERVAREHAEAERLSRELAEEAERIARERADAEQRALEKAIAESTARELALTTHESTEGAADESTSEPQAVPAAHPSGTLEQEAADEDPPEAGLVGERSATADAAAARPAPPEVPLVDVFEGRRRRKKEKSVRARKDRLHSASARGSSGGEERAERRKDGAWLVRPDHAAAFDPALPEPAAPVSPPVAVPPPPGPGATEKPVENTMVSSGSLQQQPAASTPAASAPPPAAPPPPPAAVKPVFQTIKLKVPEGKPHGTLTRAPRTLAPRESSQDFSPHTMYDPPVPERRMPWKSLAAAVVILMAGGYAAMTLKPGLVEKPAAAPAAVGAAAVPAAADPAASVGSVEITTQPAGARVLFDGKPAGQSPVSVPGVSPGRHTVTVFAEAGTVKRTVKVEAGATANVEIPIFSGFAAISAPIVLEVTENGRSLGSSDNHVMLTPGRHELALSNKELRYSITETVDVEPGEVKEVKVDPKGAANINAQPWAEVWIDGEKVGETPLANLPLTLGSREIVFKNPQFGERKVTATITAGAPANISVDLSK